MGGLIEVDPDGLPPEVLRRRETRLRARLAAARAEGGAEHPFFSGASLGVTVAALLAAPAGCGPCPRSRTRRWSAR